MTKIALDAKQVENLAKQIEAMVGDVIREYTDAKINEELEPIFNHIAELYQTIGQLSTDMQTVTAILQAHIEGATNAPDTNPDTRTIGGSRDLYGGS